LGVIAVAIAAIGWSIWRMPEPRAPDPLSCSAAGNPLSVRGRETPKAGPKLSLNVAFLGNLSHDYDYCVFRDHRPIGRIRIAKGTPLNPDWQWEINLPLPIPAWGHGSATSLPEANEAFLKAWERFYAGLTAADIAHWDKMPDIMITR
jgi:hypothetical protein